MADATSFAKQLLSKADVEVGGDRPWDIEVHDSRVWDRVLQDRELGLGESYVEGWWDCDAVDELITRVICADLKSHIRPGLQVASLAARSMLRNRQSRRRSVANARAHYDIGNDLYERMLDKRMLYTCAYWDASETLGAAQEAKLDLICQKLALEPGMTVLDIGCGWGGFVQFAAERYGVTATGISPALEQVRLAQQRVAGLNVTIEAKGYRELTGTFDRIVSIGMFEHVGPRNYKSFFTKCGELLAPEGLMLHHTIGGLESKRSGDPWIDRYIFPGGHLPSISQIGRATENSWVIEDLHNFGPDYDRTLMAWLANIDSAWHEIPDYDEQFRRMWRYYLMACAGGFRSRSTQLWQLVMRRSHRPSSTYRSVR